MRIGSTTLTRTKLFTQENIRPQGTALSSEDYGKMSLRDGEPMTSESLLEVKEQDILGSKDCRGFEESSNQVINEWFLDNVISFARSPAGSSYPRASSNDQDISITPTTSPISPRNSAANSVNSRFALIILNQPIEMRLDDFLEIWTRAEIVICADGGANHLHKFSEIYGQWFFPSVIAGDFDSIKDSVATFYRTKSPDFAVEFRRDNSQYYTDFDKAIDVVKEYEKSRNMKFPWSVIALGGLGGRVDQSFSLINQLYKSSTRRLYLLSPQNISFLLPSGHNRVHASKVNFGPTCGIIPISGPTTITLEGFRWNLDNFVTEFGGLVSTSNELVGDTAIVTTDKPVLWTIELRQRSESAGKEYRDNSPIGQTKYTLKIVNQPDA